MEEEKRLLYFCTKKKKSNVEMDTGRWFSSTLDLSSSSIGTAPLVMSPTLKTSMPPDHAFSLGTVVALGSVIYHLGGCPCPSSKIKKNKKKKKEEEEIPLARSAKVFYFDTRRPDEGWKKAPSMLASRLEPVVYAADGRIFVFGGCYEGNYPYAEFLEVGEDFGFDFDWSPLSLTPHDHQSLSPNIMPIYPDYWGGLRFLLFHVKGHDDQGGYLYSYDLCFGGFTLIDEQFGIWHYPLVAVGRDDLTLIYGCTGTSFSIYNLCHRKWLSNIPIQLPRPPSLAPLGNPKILIYIGHLKFCFIWPCSKNGLITCTVVSLVAGEEEKEATIESSTVYRLDGDHRLLYCLAL